jgi:hypothetical protein
MFLVVEEVLEVLGKLHPQQLKQELAVLDLQVQLQAHL